MAHVPWSGNTRGVTIVPDGPDAPPDPVQVTAPTPFDPDAWEPEPNPLSGPEDSICREVAAGLEPRAISIAHRIRGDKLREFLERPEAQACVAKYRQRLEDKAATLVAKAWLAAADALDTIIEIAKSPQHRKHYESNLYLLERVWPKPVVVDQTSHHTVDMNILAGVIDSIEKMKAVRASHTNGYSLDTDPHIQDGADVSYGVPIEVPPATGDVGESASPSGSPSGTPQ